MNKVLLGFGLGLAIFSTSTAIAWSKPSKTPATPQKIAQNGSQAAQTRVLDLGVSQDQLLQMKSLGMRMVMPKNVPPGFQLKNFIVRKDSRFQSYLLVYRKGSACFGVEGTTGGIGSIPAGTASYSVKNAVLGQGQIEQRSEAPQLVGQWLGRGPFYRFVGAGYDLNGSSELAGCQNVTPKEAVFVSEALRYIDLEAGILEPVPVVDANSPTSTVVRYPSREELNQFNRKLKSGAFGNGVKLSAEQRKQRQAYQATWAQVNPTAAKFAGAWIAGDRTYYVYPSKVKSRVCVVTLTDGKYEFANGQSISREMRYLNNGFFWVDQSEVLAARDTGTGQLYPVFASAATPDPAELTNFDFGFQNATCTTVLPGQ
ncbi:MAG: hypothetical protein NW224_02990 [Leptolyngbyaceae cyanobacterium bins.302]|nr:hypothetical protein [Leptolyngbyaceae cyanobacterium bins.302]